MDNNLYQFITLVYNHEDLIEDHLDSILFQKTTYGLDKKIILTLFDDSSTDNSLKVIEGWVLENRTYFFDVQLISNSSNLGIKFNYLKSLSHIITNKYKLLGGDDLYLNQSNVFEYMDFAADKLIVFSPMLVNGNYTLRQRKYLNSLYFFLNRRSLLKKTIFNVNQFNAPGAYISPIIFRSENYINYLINSPENYEDWPSWKYIFGEKEYRFDVYYEPIVDYRPSSDRSNGISKNTVFYRVKSVTKFIVNSIFIRVFKKNGFILVMQDIYFFKTLVIHYVFK